MTGNYLQTANPYNLSAPPEWWLTKLHDYDSELVVFPSQIRPAYILARKRSKSLLMPELLKVDGDLLKKSAGLDGDILAAHKLVYIRHLLGNSIRREAIFLWLRQCDVWAAGGADKFIDRIETAEQSAETKKRSDLLDNIEHRAGDAYRSYQARTGQRNQHANARGGKAPGARIIHSGVL